MLATGNTVYLHTAGIVEMSSRRMGNRSKTLLKKGQTLGEHAILDGEPAAETCVAGSPVVALLVNRSVNTKQSLPASPVLWLQALPH